MTLFGEQASRRGEALWHDGQKQLLQALHDVEQLVVGMIRELLVVFLLAVLCLLRTIDAISLKSTS
jgi:hypothetical protein